MTPIEWLLQELRGYDDKGDFIFNGVITSELIEQAKEMEKQQQGYSEKEVIELLEYTRENFYDTGTNWHSEPDTDYTSEELFEQFKKK